MNSVKKILPVLIELAIVALGVWAASNMPASKPAEEKPAEMTPGLRSAVYHNADFGFSMQYPENAEIKSDYGEGYLPATHNLISAIMLPRSMFAGTNLGEAGIFIGVSPEPETVKNCANIGIYDEAKDSRIVKINGEEFREFDSLGVGAGNYYDFKIFRTVRHGSCYEIAALLHSSNIHNYDPGTVKEFDKEKFSEILKTMTESFIFTADAGSGIIGKVELSPTCPVQRIPADPGCAPKPYETEITVFRSGDSEIHETAKTDSDGRFFIRLSPGRYDFNPVGGKFLPRCGSATAEISDQAYSYAVFSCDSGIR